MCNSNSPEAREERYNDLIRMVNSRIGTMYNSPFYIPTVIDQGRLEVGSMSVKYIGDYVFNKIFKTVLQGRQEYNCKRCRKAVTDIASIVFVNSKGDRIVPLRDVLLEAGHDVYPEYFDDAIKKVPLKFSSLREFYDDELKYTHHISFWQPGPEWRYYTPGKGNLRVSRRKELRKSILLTARAAVKNPGAIASVIDSYKYMPKMHEYATSIARLAFSVERVCPTVQALWIDAQLHCARQVSWNWTGTGYGDHSSYRTALTQKMREHKPPL